MGNHCSTFAQPLLNCWPSIGLYGHQSTPQPHPHRPPLANLATTGPTAPPPPNIHQDPPKSPPAALPPPQCNPYPPLALRSLPKHAANTPSATTAAPGGSLPPPLRSHRGSAAKARPGPDPGLSHRSRPPAASPRHGSPALGLLTGWRRPLAAVAGMKRSVPASGLEIAAAGAPRASREAQSHRQGPNSRARPGGGGRPQRAANIVRGAAGTEPPPPTTTRPGVSAGETRWRPPAASARKGCWEA